MTYKNLERGSSVYASMPWGFCIVYLITLRFLYNLSFWIPKAILTVRSQVTFCGASKQSLKKIQGVSCHVILLGQDFTEVDFLIHSIKTAGAFHKTTKQLKFWLVRYLCLRTAGDTLPGLWSPSGYVHKGDQFVTCLCSMQHVLLIWLCLFGYLLGSINRRWYKRASQNKWYISSSLTLRLNFKSCWHSTQWLITRAPLSFLHL